jgi:hypothetical protein
LVCSNSWACSSSFSCFLELVSAGVVLCLSPLQHFQCSASESHMHWIMLHDHCICPNAFCSLSVWVFTTFCKSVVIKPLRKQPHPTLVCDSSAFMWSWLVAGCSAPCSVSDVHNDSHVDISFVSWVGTSHLWLIWSIRAMQSSVISQQLVFLHLKM